MIGSQEIALLIMSVAMCLLLKQIAKGNGVTVVEMMKGKE